ncbi:MAG: DUF2604 domain-containing protein [Gemmatimonadaceae bacterium]
MGAGTSEIGTAAGRKNPNTYEIFVGYNGVEKTITANANETVQALLSRAVSEFGITTQPHILSLWNLAGVELPEGAKVGEMGISPGVHLLLRPGAVKGGRGCCV